MQMLDSWGVGFWVLGVLGFLGFWGFLGFFGLFGFFRFLGFLDFWGSGFRFQVDTQKRCKRV